MKTEPIKIVYPFQASVYTRVLVDLRIFDKKFHKIKNYIKQSIHLMSLIWCLKIDFYQQYIWPKYKSNWKNIGLKFLNLYSSIYDHSCFPHLSFSLFFNHLIPKCPTPNSEPSKKCFTTKIKNDSLPFASAWADRELTKGTILYFLRPKIKGALGFFSL